MKVLVTGGRNRYDWMNVLRILYTLHKEHSNIELVHGAAPGIDTLASDIAAILDWRIHSHPADWSLGRRAGSIRNSKMLDIHPDISLCIAFPSEESIGTWDMIRKAKAKNIEVIVYEK